MLCFTEHDYADLKTGKDESTDEKKKGIVHKL